MKDEIDAFISEYVMTKTSIEMKLFENAKYAVVRRLLFHWTIVYGQLFDEVGYDQRWCYETEQGALAALRARPEGY
ncbi:hypothetical protein [Tistrella sp.]|uniref:hypothetical protein n=1 Tax=Tistrella sp. TaxID=2024861 RepID=UPI0025FD300C|nr:hypothetical protein [Tistrella sp.]|tara:strand:+ start:155 stop:382 length:228 start_codon:yes stop_codon:yes gene_type:complete